MVISNWENWSMVDGSRLFGSFQWYYEGIAIPENEGPGVFWGTKGPCLLIVFSGADGTYSVTLTGKCGTVTQSIELAWV